MIVGPAARRRAVALATLAVAIGFGVTPAHADPGEIGFAAVRTYAGAMFSPNSVYGPAQIASADFDLDGLTDLVVNNCGGLGPLLLRNTGDGAFAEPTTILSLGDACAVDAADVNDDGRPDLLVGSWLTNSVSVLVGNGDLTFRAGLPAIVVGFPPMQFASADFNRDGHADVAALGNVPGTANLLWGQGDGTFRAGERVGVGGVAMSFAAGDFNHDGAADLVAGDVAAFQTNSTGNTLNVVLNNGDGTFAGPVGYDTGGSSAEYTVAADLDHDGHVDLVAANANSGNLSLLYGRGDGSFETAQLIQGSGLGKPGVQVADFDHDGRLDLASTVTVSNQIEIHRGIGHRQFVPAGRHATGDARLPQSIVTDDLNGDGFADLAAPGYMSTVPLLVPMRVAVLLNMSV